MLALLTALVAIPATSADALSQRGHTLLGSFGKEGSGAGEIKEPRGVAVNESTGDIYVVDGGNARIDQFNSKHEFKAAFGFGVANGEHKYQICTTTCLPGQAAAAKGEMYNAQSIAVDNSTNPKDPSKGDVYVEIPEFEVTVGNHEVVHEFGAITKLQANGELLPKGGQIKFWTIEKVRLNEKGEPILNKKGEPEKEVVKEEIEEEMNGITVDPAGNLYLYYEESVIKFDDAAANNNTLAVFTAEVEEAHGIAVGTGGRTYLADSFPTGAPPVISEYLFGLEEPLLDAVYDKPTSGLAYDYARNDLLLDNITSVAVLNSENQPVETLGSGQLTKGSGIAVNGASEHIYVADQATGQVLDFAPEEPGAPTFGPTSSQHTTGTSTELSGAVNPHGGQETQFSFRVSTGPVPGPESPCVSPCVESALKTLGSEGFEEVPVGPIPLSGLAPETKYRYRVFAQNKVGASTLTAESPESFFTTLYAPGSTLPDGRAWEQVSPVDKNGSALQPYPGEGGVIQAAEGGEAITYLGSGAIPNSEGNPEPEGNYAPYLTQMYGHWKPTGWSAHNLDVRHEKAEGVFPGQGNYYQVFGSDLTYGALQSFAHPGAGQEEEPPLNHVTGQEATPYLRSQEPACLESPAPGSCFIALANKDNAAGHPFGSAVTFAGGNAELSDVVINSQVALTSQAVPSKGNLYERTAASPGTLELVSRLPNNGPASNAVLGGGPLRNIDHAVSENGNRVFFTTTETGTQTRHLYMRDVELGKTIQIDVQQPGVVIPEGVYPKVEPQANLEQANFMSASADGSIVFFTDEWRLTPNSQAGFKQFDLYACRIKVEANEPKCELTDLTVSHNAEERAGVQSVLGTGSSSAGTSVYYVANGQLAANAEPSQCLAGTASAAKQGEESEEGVEIEALQLGRLCNLYVQRFNAAKGNWENPKLVARLSAEDEPDWLTQSSERKAGSRGPLGSITSRVSPNGEFLTFMSDRNLTGYDTRDAGNGRGDEEVYSYDRSGGKLACVSCNRGGSRPHGLFDTVFSGEGIGLLIDRPRTWRGRKLAANVPGWTNWNLPSVDQAYYQSRYLDNEGRVFFNSVEALVPQDTNGKPDVYEWEPTGVGGCTPAAETYTEAFSEGLGGCISLISSGKSDASSAFLDASATGNDVFFLTGGQLVKQDQDTSFDVYDATVCGREGARPCLPEPEAAKAPCTELKTCRPGEGEVSNTPTFGTPTSGTPSGTGNTSKSEVLPAKEEGKSSSASVKPKAKPLTRQQKLAKALKACKAIKSHSKRVACEKAAHKKYGAKKASAHKSVAHRAGRRGR
jgi:hypothetical protein